jgi:hypothetical protein
LITKKEEEKKANHTRSSCSLGCKCTPAKGMASCEKNEHCKACCIVILFYYNNNNCFFSYFFLRPNCWKTNFFTEALIQSNLDYIATMKVQPCQAPKKRHVLIIISISISCAIVILTF